MNGTIELLGMEFHAFHGCLPEERAAGNRFVVDFRCEYDIEKASRSDRLEDTLNYAEVYDIVAREMSIPSDLLEHVAGRIARALKESHPELGAFSVSVAKQNPPVQGKAAWSRVTVRSEAEPEYDPTNYIGE